MDEDGAMNHRHAMRVVLSAALIGVTSGCVVGSRSNLRSTETAIDPRVETTSNDQSNPHTKTQAKKTNIPPNGSIAPAADDALKAVASPAAIRKNRAANDALAKAAVVPASYPAAGLPTQAKAEVVPTVRLVSATESESGAKPSVAAATSAVSDDSTPPAADSPSPSEAVALKKQATDSTSGASKPNSGVPLEAALPADVVDGELGVEAKTPESGKSEGLSLGEVVATALNSSPDLASAGERIAQADSALARARAEFFPKLTVGEFYGASNIPALSFLFLINQRALSVKSFGGTLASTAFVNNLSSYALLHQNIYAGGRRVENERSAADIKLAQAHALDAARNELVFRAAEAYYRLIQARDLIRIRELEYEQVGKHLTIAQARYDAGTAVESDVLTVKVRLAEVREALISSRNNLELGWSLLENVTGCRFPRRDLPAAIPAAPWASRVGQVEAAVAESMARRPEISESSNRQSAAAHDVEATKAGKRPTIDFFGLYSTFSGDSRYGGNGLFAGLLAQWTIFDGHRTKSEVCRAEARVRELQANHRRLMLDIELETRQSIVRLADAQERLNVARQAVEQARRSLAEIESRYRAQTSTITQLIDAQVALSNARVRRSSALVDLEIARASIERSLGGFSSLVMH
jgi:outer membrane protein